MIDPHVHCRDWKQDYKETIKHALSVAERAGISGIFDMPNTDPLITSRYLVEERLKDARKIKSKVFYGLYIGITANEEQIKEAVKVYRDFFPGVVGFKMFAGHSVGDLTVAKGEEQKLVYKVLAEEGYTGVLAVHCEKEYFMKSYLWDNLNPISHNNARPPEAEIKSIEDQIDFAISAGFKGKLHILHVSVPESVDLIEKKKDKINLSCGVTPHHCILNIEAMLDSEDPILLKVNPPLRSRKHSDKMLDYLKKGKIDFIESDHAPHTLKEKKEKFMSGFPGLPFYPYFMIFLRKEGFSDEQIRDLTHNNICNIFGFNLKEIEREPDLNLHKEYEVDVYDGARKWLRKDL